MKMKKIKNKNIKGVSLIEALVSTAIIGIGFVAILQMTNYSVQSIHTSGERTKANSLINMIAEDVIGNKSAGISTENFSEFIKTKLQTDSNDLSKLCSSNAPKSQDSGNIYGTYDKTTAIAEFGEKRTASKQGQNFIKEARSLKTPGWRAVRPKKQNLPDGWGELPSNPADATLASHEFKEEKTKPPGRLKEAGLLRLMEHAGKKI